MALGVVPGRKGDVLVEAEVHRDDTLRWIVVGLLNVSVWS